MDAILNNSMDHRLFAAVSDFGPSFIVRKILNGGSRAITVLGLDTELDCLVVRKISQGSQSAKLRSQAHWLKSRAGQIGIPQVLREFVSGTNYVMDMKYEEGYESFFGFIHDNDVEHSLAIIDEVLRRFCEFRGPSEASPQNLRMVENYLQRKLFDKIDSCRSLSPEISDLLLHDELIINGQNMTNFSGIVAAIMDKPEIMHDLSCFSEMEIHGDLTIENILVNKDQKFLLIDSNDENIISSTVVDIAKLFQSLHSNYEFLLQNKTVSVKKTAVTFDERSSKQYQTLHVALVERMRDKLTPSEQRALLFHEAIHFSRMLPYRIHHSPRTATQYFAICIRLLNQFYAQYVTH